MDIAIVCDAIGCNRPADWAYIGQGDDLYLCEFHGGAEPVDGWARIPERPTPRGIRDTPGGCAY